MEITKENAISALKKALEHKKEAKKKFEKWLQEKGVEGKVVALWLTSPYNTFVIGKKGTAARNDFEARLKAEIDAYQIGEAIKQTRQQQNLTT